MFLNFFSVLVVISVFLTLFLSLFFFMTPKGVKNENRTLALLLLVFNLQIIYSFMTSENGFRYFMEWHKPIFIMRQTSFLIGPLLYLYINSFLKKKEIFTRVNLAHLIPFLVIVTFLSVYFQFVDNFIIWESPVDLVTTVLILGSNFVYIALSLVSLRSSRIGFRGVAENLNTSPQNAWIQILLIGYVVIWIVNLNSFAIFMILRRPGWCAYTASIYALTSFLFVNALMLLLLIRPDIYYFLTKYKNNKVQENDKTEFLRRLNVYMEVHKPFLNPDISLESLASEIQVNPRTLSMIINETYKKSFKNYILEFRLAESMKILADEKARKLTILEVLYQVGFNSKSAFNNQFKLYTNHTPQEYRAKFVN